MYNMFGKKSKGHNIEVRKEGTTIIAGDISSLPNTHSHKIARRYHEWSV